MPLELGPTLSFSGAQESTVSKFKSKVVAPRNPKLVRSVKQDDKTKPSKYMLDMSLDTEKRLASQHTMKVPRQIELLDMSETTLQKVSVVNIDEPLFQPFPSEIFFQNFEPFKTYEVPLLLRNSDKVPRLVKVTHQDSPYFKIESPPNCANKVGAGLPITYKVLFTPDEKRDYIHELVCITEREKFVIPIHAIGARAILDFPDEVTFPVCPVKYTNSRILLVRNVGNRDARFTLQTEKPFSVTPDKGELAVSATMQVSLDYFAERIGEHNGELVLHYETGEDVYIALHGISQDVAVKLEKSVVTMDPTFISLSSGKTVVINNRSDVVAHYRWTRFGTSVEEEQQKMTLRDSLSLAESLEKSRFKEETDVDPTGADRTSIITRSYLNKKRLLDADQMLFTDDAIKLDPIEGDIWPNSTAEISVTFHPDAARTYSRTAFCDVTGRESRLPLQISGEGLGPHIVFSHDCVDIGSVFVFSTHSYEIVLGNIGAIDAIFTLETPTSALGRCFRFDPYEGIVMPDGHQAIRVTFSSRVVGDFCEDFYFTIDGAREKVKISFCGVVVAPSLHFDVPKLDFGIVSYGFEKSRKCILSNTSLVPVTYYLRIPDDGRVPSVRSRSPSPEKRTGSAAIAASVTNVRRREFEISPQKGVLAPQSSVEISVELCANRLHKYNTELCVDVEAVQDGLLRLPVVARSIVPEVSVATPLLNLGRCFLRHQYQCFAELRNESDLPAKYELLPCTAVDGLDSILYLTPEPQGILEARTTTRVPLIIIAQDVKELDTTAHFIIVGASPGSTLPVQIVCFGEGPVVHITPSALDWGQVHVLVDTPRILQLSNESLIPARFTTKLVRGGNWLVEPSEGEIEAESYVKLVVTACLDDSLTFTDKLLIDIENGPTHSVPLSAIGRGSTIISEPPMAPVLDLGPHFSRNICQRVFKLTNCGRRHQSIIWSTDGFPLMQRANKRKQLPALQQTKDARKKDGPAEPERFQPVFSVTPQRLELNPGESAEIILEGTSDIAQIIQEKLLCHAIIGRAGGKELIKKVQVVCEFINPLLNFSGQSLSFTIHKKPEDELELEYASVEMTNVSSLPLAVKLSLNRPFKLMVEDSSGVLSAVPEISTVFAIGEMKSVTVQFDPAYKPDRHSRTVDDVLTISYLEHPHVDYIQLHGQVHFPNLQFEKTVVDFGCILNNTEVTRYLNITNTSPMDVNYRWSFVLDGQPVAFFRKPQLATAESEQSLELLEVEPDGIGSINDEQKEIPEMVDVSIEGMDSSPRDFEYESRQSSHRSETLDDKKQLIIDNNDDNDEKKDEEKPEVSNQIDEDVSKIPSPGRSASSPAINKNLALILQQDSSERTPPGVEEIFDILPIYGTLRPSEAEQITMTFYGHANIVSEALALCEVEGGPTYEIVLKGEASLVNYKFDFLEIDYNKIMYDQEAVAQITLFNTGHVGLDFVGIGMDPCFESQLKPGVPVMIPHAGHIKPLSEQTLTIKYLPRGPQKFQTSFQIQVAHFEPETIKLYGEGVFPRIFINLPRFLALDPCSGDEYHRLMTAAKENLMKDLNKMLDNRPASALSDLDEVNEQANAVIPLSDIEIQLEMERLVVEEFVINHPMESESQSDILVVDSDVANSRALARKLGKIPSKQRKPVLPDYLLDFGHVVLGNVCTKTVNVTNTGWFPVSFSTDRNARYQHGFSVDLPRIVQLPGAPDHEVVDFNVTFDPRGANLGTGLVEAIVPINVVGGPLVQLFLRAVVTIPDLQISTDIVDFGEVKCGECRIVNVLLHNHQAVQCEWTAVPMEDSKKPVDKHVPMHLRRKTRQEKPVPATFEIIPTSGVLQPNQYKRIEVKFMPAEQKSYENRLLIKLSQSSQRVVILCRGQGLEPQIEFNQTLVKFGPILPHSPGDEKEVVIRNPCKFPVEIYSLEFDKLYLDEEKILRLMKGYDEFNTILLPPRLPAEKLPQELLDYYEEQVKKLEETERIKREAEEVQSDDEKVDVLPERTKKSSEDMTSKAGRAPSRRVSGADIGSKELKLTHPVASSATKQLERWSTVEQPIGDLEDTAVSAAIARHLGIDTSVEGRAARNRRGIAIIVHGAPMSGKSTVASALAARYDVIVMKIDDVIVESMKGNSSNGVRARDLCAEAARRFADENRPADDAAGSHRGPPGGLSMEAVNAHTQQGLSVAQSTQGSNRKTSTIVSDVKASKHHGSTGGGKGGLAGGPGGDSQVFSSGSPVPTYAPRRISIGTALAGEEGLVSTILPDDVVVGILADRFLRDDCSKGIVFDGLESIFTASHHSTAMSILKALNNRKYIFSISLKLDYNFIKEKERKAQEEKERVKLEKEDLERRHLEEMSEDEYDALTDDQKAEVDRQRLVIKKERLKREKAERLERERREEEERQEAERRRQEEDSRRRKKRGVAATGPADKKDGKKSVAAGKVIPDKFAPVQKALEVKKPHDGEAAKLGQIPGVDNKPDIVLVDKVDPTDPNADEKKKREKSLLGKDGKRPMSTDMMSETKTKSQSKDSEVETSNEDVPKEKDVKSEAEQHLIQRFRVFEHGFKEVSDLFDWWERATGMIHPSAAAMEAPAENVDDGHQAPASRKKNKGKKMDPQISQQPVAEQADGERDLNQEANDEEKQEKRLQEGIGIPHMVINHNNVNDRPLFDHIVAIGKLPPPEEVLDGLGLGPKGPPVPPPAMFAVVPYPVKRQAPTVSELGQYTFTFVSVEDPSSGSQEDKSTEQDQDEVKSSAAVEKDHVAPTQSKASSRRVSTKHDVRGKDQRKKSPSGKSSRSGGRRTSVHNISPTPGGITPASDADGRVYRWVIPAESEIILKLCFAAEESGQFDQTLNFEIVGTRRRYQLFCRGVCAFPTISREPRVVFANRKKAVKADEIISKKYIMSSDIFEFGPLLAGKSRDKYKDNKYPENVEKFTIKNSSPLDAEVKFCFLNDTKGDTYLLEPATMLLKPEESQELTIWAFPKAAGTYDDALVCCITENPEPVVFKIRSYGVRPELELDRKALHFDKVLLHRKDAKSICFKNNTLLPVAWKLTGLEMLGDDFSVSQEGGIVQPKSEFVLNVYFRSLKPIVVTRKAIRVEVSDVDNILGLLQTEVIQIHAEAYDVALDMSFPKGMEGGIDFDTIRVKDEVKQTCTLKNKGKYDISYSFTFEPTSDCPREICNMFTVSPQRGTLSPTERAINLQVGFQSKYEIVVKEQPILYCNVIEPSLGDSGEVIARIPVKVSVRSVFTKYSINPMNDLNFGALLMNSKKTRTFTIENRGDKFDLKYVITKMNRDESKRSGQDLAVKKGRRVDGSDPKAGAKAKRDGPANGTSANDGKPEPSTAETEPKVQKRPEGPGQTKLIIGPFTVYPAFGTVQPGNQQTITVDCLAESTGICIEEISIDVVGREPNDNKDGIPYRLMSEVCIPSINVEDLGSIFEEHRVCRSLNSGARNVSSGTNLDLDLRPRDQLCGGIYGEEERKFVFSSALVGIKSKARFKITNTKKVPCEVAFSIKPLVAVKAASKQPTQEVFEVTPNRVQIPPHRHVYANVTFCPPAMQQYGAIFEASIETTPANQPKGRSLTFELSGEGNLPHIAVVRPTIRNKRCQPLLLFRQTLVGRMHALPIVIVNDGTLTCKVDINVTDADNVFSLRVAGGGGQTVRSLDGYHKSTILDVDESTTFEVTFRPTSAKRSLGQVRLSVVDNQYEDILIQLVAEGYQDDISIDCGDGLAEDDVEDDGSFADDDVPATKANIIKFGDRYVRESQTLTFTMTNQSDHHVRFAWPETPNLKFVPREGHLHAGSSKDLSVTLKSDQPLLLKKKEVVCQLVRIAFEQPIGEVADWDDRLKTVKWVSAALLPSSSDVTLKEGQQQQISESTVSLRSKKKVIEIEPEPAYNELPDSVKSVSVLVQANVNYSKYQLKEDSLRFRDTLMFQTRVYQLDLVNTGSVPLEYSWQIVMDDFTTMRTAASTAAIQPPPQRLETPRPVTAGPLLVQSGTLRPSSSLSVNGTPGVDDVRPVSGNSAEPPLIPFVIEPANGVIGPGKSAAIAVKFSPLDVNDYEGRLICSIPNLEPGSHGPVVGVRARSLLPYCHFELEDSDYIRGGRRNPELLGPRGSAALDPNTRVIEFQSSGVGVLQTVKFDVINPTNQNYSFAWTCDDTADPKKTQNFVCHTPSGTINSGKKVQMWFEFVSSSLDLTESFWKFRIFEQNVSVPFLLVGVTRDPDVAFDRSHINFRSVLIGHEATDTVFLVNNENEPMNFSFVESSCQAAGYTVSVILDPMRGTIPPKSKAPVAVRFTPAWEKEVNFNVVCTVKRKQLPLTLNVKAEGFSLNCLVTCEDLSGERMELSSSSQNVINFGRVEIKEKAVRTLSVINLGQYLFDFNWELRYQSPFTDAICEVSGGKEDSDIISLTPLQGAVDKGERKTCLLTFAPPQPMVLRNCDLTLKISLGPTYHIRVSGSSVLPGIQFSTLSHNFGSCFVFQPNMPQQTYVLKLSNTDTKDISVDCLYQSTAWLSHNFEPCVIPSKKSVEATFTFSPREAVKYKESVTFEINGLSRQIVEFVGMGTDLKVEVADPRQKVVKFGAMRIGQSLKKIVPIVNNSAAPLTFNVTINPMTGALQDQGVIRLTPVEPITLQQKGGMAKVEVTLTPKCRIAQFSEEVHLECSGLFQTLFVITGSCQGLEVSLDTESVPFGAVVQNSSSTRQVIMNNTGDIGAKFKWDVSKLGPNFTLTPTEGYIAAGMDVPFDIVFHPRDTNTDIRCENVRCQVEGLSKPLRLTLTGACTAIQPSPVIHFSTHVRQKETKSLQIQNHNTSLTYNIRPVIDGVEHWSGPEMFVVPPQTTQYYELVYYPMTMTTSNKHTGSIFFPLPDGQGLMHNLVGTADPPKVSGKLSHDVPCKTTFCETLAVQNWLKKSQRFRVKIECIKPDKLDPGTTVKGLDYIDVPGLATRDYKLTFHSHKECQPLIKVVFLNEQTGEYQFYEIQFRAVRPGVQGSIQLTTMVRQRKPHTVTLENPLSTSVTFAASCTIPEIQMPSQIVVSPMSEGAFTLEYFPMKAGNAQGKLEFTSNDLGLYQYDVELRALPASPEKALSFQTYLGSSQVLVAKFLNFVKHKTDYVCKLDHQDYHVDKSIAAAPAASSGTEVVVEVTYEPSSIGESRTNLTITSPVGGDYTFPLVGVCMPPKPQGPFVIKAGSTIGILFRNVFAQTMTFQFAVDNSVFHIAKPSETIRSRKDHRIVIAYDGSDTASSKAPVVGRLVVSCVRATASGSASGSSGSGLAVMAPPNTQWIYYLRGENK